jgi:hypothetical protein
MEFSVNFKDKFGYSSKNLTGELSTEASVCATLGFGFIQSGFTPR